MEGFDNPRFNMSRQPQATLIAPATPLSIHAEIPGSDLHRREETGTPGLLQLSFGVRTIADNHRFLGVDLHVGMPQGFKHTLVAVAQVVREVGSGSNQDHVIDILPYLDAPSRTLQGAYQERMQKVYRQTTPGRKST
eukprot:3375701-Amphidinium_carterae.1